MLSYEEFVAWWRFPGRNVLVESEFENARLWEHGQKHPANGEVFGDQEMMHVAGKFLTSWGFQISQKWIIPKYLYWDENKKHISESTTQLKQVRWFEVSYFFLGPWFSWPWPDKHHVGGFGYGRSQHICPHILGDYRSMIMGKWYLLSWRLDTDTHTLSVKMDDRTSKKVLN